MPGYTSILALLDELEAADRHLHEQSIQQARLKLVANKNKMLVQAGFIAMAKKWQQQADTIISRFPS
ncbi:MAG: hypothetical protein AB7U43_02310 [Desulfobacter sp.]|jgi:triphosphoribosyl-dephospho-CoA synthetase